MCRALLCGGAGLMPTVFRLRWHQRRQALDGIVFLLPFRPTVDCLLGGGGGVAAAVRYLVAAAVADHQHPPPPGAALTSSHCPAHA